MEKKMSGVSLPFGMMVIFGLMVQVCVGDVYKVGGSVGWTIVGNVNYKQWSAPKTFKVGDIILFQYNSQFHNVMQVTHAAYKSCNASSPISTHTTGNDSITITNQGHHFFICGVPGHCQSGQKVDINVLRDSVRAQSPSSTLSSPPPSVNPDDSVPAPSPSEVANSAYLSGTCISSLICFAAVVIAAFV